MAKPIEIRGFRGINRSHTRELGQLSGGKNFRTRLGGLFSRPGSVSVTVPNPCGAIKSLHAAPKVSADTRLLLEEGTSLWHKAGAEAWANIKNNLNGTRLDSCRWQDYLILVNGNDKLAYDLTSRTLTSLGGPPPALEYVIYWKFRIFGWAPNFTTPHRLHFCGYDANGEISKDVWPGTFYLDIGGSAGRPVLEVIPYNTHLVAFTRYFFKRVYGDDDTNFEILDGADIGVYNSGLAALVSNKIFWVAPDKRVYRYSGSSPVTVSDGIDELLASEDFADAFALSLDSMFWLFFPGDTTTKVYIFDPLENDWYIDVYPAVIKAGYAHGAYNSPESIYFGTQAGTMFKIDSSATTDFGGTEITTEAELGPVDLAGAEFWVNNMHVQADPKNSFQLDVYASCDRRPEQGPFSAYFTAGAQDTKEIMLRQVRGKNISLKLSSTDRINELQKLTINISAWGVNYP